VSLENTLNAVSTLGPSSLLVVVAQPDERHANKIASVLECYDRHRAVTEHTTSDSNEEERVV